MMQSIIEQNHIEFDENGLPYSKVFEDKYFCAEDGLGESEYTFCRGNNLKERFRDLSDEDGDFTIIETGFGSGLNFLCAWKLWREVSPQNAQLHYISLDQYPMTVSDLDRTLSLWPSVQNYKEKLTKEYSAFNERCNCAQFEESNVKVTVIFDHVNQALDTMIAQSILADAWFLDGFAPSKNPDMWSQGVFERMAQLSQAKATMATFTSAGFVMRGLRSSGFDVNKVQGFGSKRHMLSGTFKGAKH